MTPAEQRLDDLIKVNERVELRGEGQQISAGFLAAVLMREEGRRPRKLSLYDFVVAGELDLEAAEIGFPVEFERCTFDHEPNVEQATAAGLYFADCTLPGLRASQVRLLDGLALHGCEVNGRVKLNGAHVSGQLDLEDCVINGAFKGDGLRVDLDVHCLGRFRVTGLTHLIGARIGGQFVCEGATFRNPGEERALDLSGLVVAEHVFWRNGFSVEGEVNLSGADIAGKLFCHDARFSSPGGTAIRAVGMNVRQEMEIGDKCTVDGELNMVGCRVGGWLKLTGGRFSNPGGNAINLVRATIALNLVLRTGTLVHGQLRLAGAEVCGTLGAQGGEFRNGNGTAIEATGLKVHGDLSLAVRDDVRFHARGQVVLNDAQIDGNLDCKGGLFENEDGDALVARGISVGRDATLSAPFIARGRVDLAGASIGGKLDLTGARLKNEGDAVRCDRVRVGHLVTFEKAHATGCVRMCDAQISSEVTFAGAVLKGTPSLKLKGTRVRGQLRLRFAERPAGRIDLRRVRAGSFADDEKDWPDRSKLDEFVYEALLDGSMALPKRLDWLRDRHAYTPQVYLQLAAVYAKAGRHDEAADVLIAKEDAKRRTLVGFPGRLHRMVWWLLNPTVGYGYRPLRILWWLGFLVVAGGFLFRWLARDPGNFAKMRGDLRIEWFDPWLYTIDLLLPVVSLDHSQLWVPLGAAKWFSLAFTVLGWVLAICLVTGLGRLFKRDDR
ncbi:hypothetical protein [Lentzea flava]|uniref:Membrane-associated oxidoreductase n=1 Tax=Lentzea flava TaxID=103732 RepID=A0ABQ2VGG4_9PSEU|nr:hypothetical protein [Lentzea flava]MCP2205333.1 hypothetical protein [Lentzea flava]GGU85850.1 hypothetical protein GCM10010178_89940 [Lentzea flava]